jgi:hypothetical protein
VPRLVDEEGAPISAEDLWNRLRGEIAGEAPAPPLDRFAEALGRAVAAAQRGDLDGVLALDGAFRALSQALAKDG